MRKSTKALIFLWIFVVGLSFYVISLYIGAEAELTNKNYKKSVPTTSYNSINRVQTNPDKELNKEKNEEVQVKPEENIIKKPIFTDNTTVKSILEDMRYKSKAEFPVELDCKTNTENKELDIIIVYGSESEYGFLNMIKENIDDILKESFLEGYKVKLRYKFRTTAIIEEYTSDLGWQHTYGGASEKHMRKVIGDYYYDKHFNY